MSTPVWRLVAEREVRTKLRDKSFVVGTGITLLLVIGIIVVSAIIGSGSDEYDVVTTSDVPAGVLEAAEPSLAAGATLERVEAADLAAVEDAVRKGEADAGIALVDGTYTLIGDESIDTEIEAALRAGVGSFVIAENARSAGTDIETLTAGSQADVRLLDPNASESDARTGIAFVFAVVFLFTALTFGMTIAQSVVQEKESRIVEILAAAVPIRSLLWGKVLGNTVLAMGQVILLVVTGAIGLFATGERDLLSGVGAAMVWYVAFFLLGFVALASLWSVAGSLASRTEDLQSTTLPGQMILFVPYFVSVLAGEGVRTVFSMLPIVSTMIMPGRMAEGSVPAWQIAVAIVATVAAAVVFVRIGSRLYERTLLRTGGKVGYREALKES